MVPSTGIDIVHHRFESRCADLSGGSCPLGQSRPGVSILRRTHEAQLLVKWEGLRVRRSRTKLSELRNARIVI
jgi:hypothetical protein